MANWTEPIGTTLRHSPWTGDRRMLDVVAPTLLDALEAALNGIVDATGIPLDTRLGRSAPLRAEATSRDGLLSALAIALDDELEDGARVSGVTMDGLVRTDTGWLAWGRLHLGAAAARAHRVMIESRPCIVVELATTTITLTLARRGT